MNEIRCWLEVNVQIKVRGVVGRDTAVNEPGTVVVLVPDASSFGVSSIQNMSDAQFLQGTSVLSHSSDEKIKTNVSP